MMVRENLHLGYLIFLYMGNKTIQGIIVTFVLSQFLNFSSLFCQIATREPRKPGGPRKNQPKNIN